MAAAVGRESDIKTTLYGINKGLKLYDKILTTHRILMHYIDYRRNSIYDFIEIGMSGEPEWQYVLLDHGKCDEFLTRVRSNSSNDFSDLGYVLDSGLGEKPPEIQELAEKGKNRLISTSFDLVEKNMGEHVYYYYLLCDNMLKKFSQGEPIFPKLKSCGKICHAGWGKEIPEVIVEGTLRAVVKNEFRLGWEEEDNEECPYYFARNGDVEKLKKLDTESYYKKDSNGWTLFHHAAYGGCVEVIRYLMKLRLDINGKEQTACGRKPVFIAAREGHLHAVEILLESEDVNDHDGFGMPLIHYASWSGNKDLVWFLIEKGCILDATDKFHRKKPIHVAAREGHTKLVSFFLENSISIEEKCGEGNTPLYYAIYNGQFETVKYLLEEGAKFFFKQMANFVMLPIPRIDDCYMLQLILENGYFGDEKDTSLQVALYRDHYCGFDLYKSGENFTVVPVIPVTLEPLCRNLPETRNKDVKLEEQLTGAVKEMEKLNLNSENNLAKNSGSSPWKSSGSNLGESSGSNPLERSGSNPRESTERNPWESSGSSSWKNSGSNLWESSGSSSWKNSGSNLWESSGSNPRESSGSNPGKSDGSNL